MSDNLLPCPFCDGEAALDSVEVMDDHVVSDRYYVFCFGCFAESANLATEAEAIAAWNRRATPPYMATPINHVELVNLGFKHAGDGLYYLPVSESRIQVMLYDDGRTGVEITENGNCDTVSMPSATKTGHLLNLIEMLEEAES